jgi:hypothetical protein
MPDEVLRAFIRACVEAQPTPVLGGRGNLSGDYPNMSIQFFSANVSWKF